MKTRTFVISLVLVAAAAVAGTLLYQRFASSPTVPPSQPVAQSTQGTQPSPAGTAVAAVVAATGSSPVPAMSSNPNPDLSVDANGLSKATVVMTTSKGVIRFKLYPQDAPNTVKRFIELVKQGFYNGLIFHRVVPGFVIQTGDPTGTGTGGSGQKLKAEFNQRRHIEGTVGMARAADPDSADSQFYITMSPQPQLDHSYTVFGQVTEGMDVVRQIQVGDKMLNVVIQ